MNTRVEWQTDHPKKTLFLSPYRRRHLTASLPSQGAGRHHPPLDDAAQPAAGRAAERRLAAVDVPRPQHHHLGRDRDDQSDLRRRRAEDVVGGDLRGDQAEAQ